MVQTGLPHKLCVLDLETEKLVTGEPGKMPLAFVGIMVYTLRAGRYRAGPHRCYFPEDLGELEAFLEDFEGVVLGHNILYFDYDEVLKYHISLEGLVERTVDTLAFLHEKRVTRYDPSCWPDVFLDLGLEPWEALRGLSLDNLSQRNLGRAKAISGRSIPKLWRQGRREEVIAYNKVDLALTFSLWWWMIKGRTVHVGESKEAVFGTVKDPGQIEISEEDQPRLTGEKPLFNSSWVIVTDGPELDPPPPDAFEEPVDYRWYRFARHYRCEDVLVFEHPIEGFGLFAQSPYPTNPFTFSVLNEGPPFPLRLPKEFDLEDLEAAW